MNADKLEAGPELDALVAIAVGLEVLGFVNVERDPECCCGQHWMIPFDYYAKAEWHGVDVRPVYLKVCFCDQRDELDVDYFGHISHCIEVVLPYSTIDAAAWNVVERLTDVGHCPGLLYDDNGHWALALEGAQDVPIGPDPQDIATTFFIEGAMWADTAPLAICRAVLKGVQNER